MKKLISLVIPGWNEHDNLVELRPLLDQIVAPLEEKYDFEFLFVDNHSEDATPELLESFAAEDPRWKYIRFSRNFGLEASFAHGVHFADGDAVLFLFSDMQDPPELIPEFIKRWEEGAQLVYGKIEKRADGNRWERIGANLTHKLLSRLTGRMIPENAADFQLLDRAVVLAVRRCRERTRYFRGLVHASGFKKCAVPFRRRPRKHGKTTMDLLFRAGYAVTSVTAFSSKPLEAVSLFGLSLTLVSMALGGVYFLSKMLSSIGFELLPTPPLGWTTLILLLLLFNGIQMFFLGIIGRYVSNIYGEVKNRPLANIERSIGFDEPLENRLEGL